MVLIGETLSNATTVEQLGVSPGQSIDINVQIVDIHVIHKVESPAQKHKKQQTIFTVQVRVGKGNLVTCIMNYYCTASTCTFCFSFFDNFVDSLQ